MNGPFTLPNSHQHNKLEFTEHSLLSGPALKALCAISNLILLTALREVLLSPPFCRRKPGLSIVNSPAWDVCLASSEDGVGFRLLT